jgi:hypothetical protein
MFTGSFEEGNFATPRLSLTLRLDSTEAHRSQTRRELVEVRWEGGWMQIRGMDQTRQVSGEFFIEGAVAADPYPNNCVRLANSDRTILFIDANGPEVVVSTKFFETERRVITVFFEERVGPL